MANEIKYVSNTTGSSDFRAQLYFDGVAVGSVITLTEIATSRVYVGSVPGGVTTPGTYTIKVYNNISGDTLGGGELIWDGAAESYFDLITLIRDLEEADENITATVIQKLLRGTSTVLLEKNVTGGQINNPPMTLLD